MVYAVTGGAIDVIPGMDVGYRIVLGMGAGMTGGADLIILKGGHFGRIGDIADSRLVQVFLRIRMAIRTPSRHILHSFSLR